MFKGFSEKTSEFMWELAFNNERPWFQAHKQEFEDVLNTPFKALAEDTLSVLSERLPELTFIPHVSRIYRDARRLFGRGPYKEKMWFSFRTAASDAGCPVFWFEIGPAEYSYGMGTWGTPALLEEYRKKIDANPAAFERMVKKLRKQLDFTIEGGEYKRPKGSYAPPVSEWYNRRSPGIVCTKPFGGDLFSPDLPTVLADEYEKMMPMFRFLMDAYDATCEEK